ncbi:hypothetical protein [Absidia glauca]|uniref:Ndc10 domain-containing protein n=1 Tax=Absidia glauca TaxID=4829 RepID=A0A163MUB5_ABSGL|nr:hypothetical protein [Absidia glauca]
MAGFSTNGRSFHLAHAALNPSTSLCKKCPTIDEWHDRLAAKKLSPDNNDTIQPTVITNCSWWNSAPTIPFGNIQSSLI